MLEVSGCTGELACCNGLYEFQRMHKGRPLFVNVHTGKGMMQWRPDTNGGFWTLCGKSSTPGASYNFSQMPDVGYSDYPPKGQWHPERSEDTCGSAYPRVKLLQSVDCSYVPSRGKEGCLNGAPVSPRSPRCGVAGAGSGAGSCAGSGAGSWRSQARWLNGRPPRPPSSASTSPKPSRPSSSRRSPLSPGKPSSAAPSPNHSFVPQEDALTLPAARSLPASPPSPRTAHSRGWDSPRVPPSPRMAVRCWDSPRTPTSPYTASSRGLSPRSPVSAAAFSPTACRRSGSRSGTFGSAARVCRAEDWHTSKVRTACRRGMATC